MNATLKIRSAFTALILSTLLLTSGVYRHDVPIEQYLDLAASEEFSCVGRLFVRGEDGENELWKPSASCVLIDSLHILTAAHAVMGYTKKDTTVNDRGYKIETYIVTGAYGRKPSDFWVLVMNQYAKAKKIVCYPGYARNYLSNPDESHDLALIELDHPIRHATEIYLNDMPDEPGDTVTGVGFGASAPGNSKTFAQGYGIKLAGQNIIDSVGGGTLNRLATKLYADFDSPPGYADCNRMGSKIPLPLEYSTQGGDSGSPLFRRKNNRLELVGILSSNSGAIPENFAKTGYYGDICAWVRISAFFQWINKSRMRTSAQ